MVRMAGRDHWARAGAGDERPVVVRLQPVVVAAQPVEADEFRAARVGPRDAVIDLGVRPQLIAALTTARRLAPQERDLLGGSRSPSQLDDAGNVAASRHDELDGRVAEQLACDAYGNRTDSRELAVLIGLDGAAPPRLDVDSQQGQVPSRRCGPSVERLARATRASKV
jgi:hypothetical protein